MTVDVGVVPPIELRDRLRIARQYAGLEQDQLAQRMEVSRSTISNAELGKNRPSRLTVRAWALACGVSHDWLAHGESLGLGIKSGHLIPLALRRRMSRTQRDHRHPDNRCTG